MKIKLVNIIYNIQWNDREHVEFETLNSCLLSAGYNSSVVYLKYEDIQVNYDAILNDLVSDASLVLFSITFYTELPIIEEIYRISESIKHLDTSIVTCVSGLITTFNYKEVLEECKGIDYILLGDFEETAVKLIERINAGESTENLEGIAFRKDNEIIKNQPNRDNFANLPWPTRDAAVLESARCAKIRTSRGCMGRCNFCIDIGYDKQWRGRDITSVVDEMESIHNKYGIKNFQFLDNSIEDPGTIGRDRLLELTKEIRARGLQIYFNCLGRAESYSSPKMETVIEELSNVGLATILIGFESGYDQDLRLFNKRASVSDNLEAYRKFTKYGVNILPGFIMFTPYSTVESLTANMNFLQEIGKSYSFVSYCRSLKVFKGVKLAEKLKEDGLILADFNYKTPLEYQFHNKNIGLFSDALNRVRYTSATSQLATTIEYCNTLIAKANKGYFECNGMIDFDKAVNEVKQEFGNHVYKFFNECIEIASSGWKENLYEQLWNELEKEAAKNSISNTMKKLIRANIKNPEFKHIL